MVDGVRIYLHAKKTLRKWIIKKFGGSGYFKNHGKSSKIFQGFSVQSMEYCISCYYWQHYAYHWNWNFIIACSSYVYMRLTQHAMQFRTQSILLSSKLFTLNLSAISLFSTFTTRYSGLLWVMNSPPDWLYQTKK